MIILGISCYFHDAAASILKDGILIAAAEEERFSRIKHDFNFPINAIEYCLKKCGITGEELDYVVFYEKPFEKFERIISSNLMTFPKSWGLFREAMLAWMLDKLWIKGLIREKVKVSSEQILFSRHHLSHGASSFLCSPFEQSAILTADGAGEWATTTMGIGSGRNITALGEVQFPHSIGLLYSAFTAFLGFEVNEGEYKVMGMAPYGTPKYEDKVWKLVHLNSDGSFWLDMDYFSFHYSTKQTFSQKFVNLFGEPRDIGSNEQLDQYYCDIAASIQKVTEEIMIHMANKLYEKTQESRLCIAGGVALNCVANGRILKETPFEELFIQPSAGDGGGALGAALMVHNSLLDLPRSFVMEHAYWGESYELEDIKNNLDSSNIPYEYFDDDESLLDQVVDAIEKGSVIGWFQGRFEYGPRALGNRSILADPRQAEMKEIVNAKIKFREAFRPFAPSILVERTEEFFDLPDAWKHYPARFMLLAVSVKENMRSKIPAVTHVDGTARVQTVWRDTNPRYYRLIEKFGQSTGVPVILNTSFNLKGEPIVTTPSQALSTFNRSGLDLLILDRFLINKKHLPSFD